MECPLCKTEITPEFTETPETPHYGKHTCPNCKAFLRWVKKPLNENKREKSKFNPEILKISNCEICLRTRGMLGANETLEVHHKMPLHLGGLDVETNVLVLCTFCHKDVHQKHVYLYEHFKIKEVPEWRF